MRDLDYWTFGDGSPKPLVDLIGAPCRRCPHPIRLVPRDKVTLLRAARGYRRSFVCPHCRALSKHQIDREEALRLYAEGVPIVRRPLRLVEPLTADEVARLTHEFGRADDLVDRALDDAPFQ